MTIRSKSVSPNKLKTRQSKYDEHMEHYNILLNKYNKYLKQRNILLTISIIELIILCVQQI